MVSNPFLDTVAENNSLFPRGSINFFKVVTEVNGVLVNPDGDAFTYTDVRRIEDPDGVDITASWVTNELDPGGFPGGGADTYDENHATYVGGQAAPPNIGLFASGAMIAQKFKVPLGAEVTWTTPGRSYRIYFGIRVGGEKAQDGDGELFEEFDVMPAGILSFGSIIVTPAEIKRTLTTGLSDPDIADLVNEVANIHVAAVLASCGKDLNNLDAGDIAGVKSAIIYWARAMVFDADASAGRKRKSIAEGSKRISFSGQDTSDSGRLVEMAMDMLKLVCGRKWRKPRFRVSKIGAPNMDTSVRTSRGGMRGL